MAKSNSNRSNMMAKELWAISELWPLSDEEAAQEIGTFLRELQIERRTGGTSQLQPDEMLSLVQEALWRPSGWKEIEIPEAEASYWMRDDLPKDSPAQELFEVVSGILRDVGPGILRDVSQGESQEPAPGSPEEETGKQKLKEQLLEKYARKEPNTFYQFDGWADEPPGDSFMIPDEEGDVVMATETQELMSSCPNVRVLVLPGTDGEQASRLLKKIAGWIERGYAHEIVGEEGLPGHLYQRYIP